MLQSMGLQRIRHDLVIQQKQKDILKTHLPLLPLDTQPADGSSHLEESPHHVDTLIPDF